MRELPTSNNALRDEAADALEAKDQRIERLEAESEDYRQGFIRVGCENAKLQAVVDAARDFVNYHMDHDDAMRIFDALDKRDGDDG